jgi:hypothetical protein
VGELSEAIQVELTHSPYILSNLGGEKMGLFDLEEQEVGSKIKLNLKLNLDQMEDL